MLPAAWQVSPPTGTNAEPALNKARSLAELVARLWENLEHRCSERVAEYALACANRRAAAFDPDRCVIAKHSSEALCQASAPRGTILPCGRSRVAPLTLEADIGWGVKSSR
jgi:hypothetical protein